MLGLVYIVDDDNLLRSSLAGILSDEGFQTKEFTSAEDFLLYPISHQPCCILLDVKMSGMSGFNMQVLLLEREFIPPIVFLTGSARLEDAVDALRTGACHFLIKPVNDEKLIDVIAEAIEESKSDAHFYSFLSKLTNTERQIAILINSGLLSKQIADQLNVSTRTIEWHRKNINAKGALPLIKK